MVSKGVGVGEQYVLCLTTWHIAPLGSWTKVVIVLPGVGILSFGNYFSYVRGILCEKDGLEWRV